MLHIFHVGLYYTDRLRAIHDWCNACDLLETLAALGRTENGSLRAITALIALVSLSVCATILAWLTSATGLLGYNPLGYS